MSADAAVDTAAYALSLTSTAKLHDNQSNIDSENLEREKYSCMARLVSLDEFLLQSQTDEINLEINKDINNDTEKKLEQNKDDTSEIGREKTEKLVQTMQNPDNSQNNSDFDLDENKLKRKIHNLDSMNIKEALIIADQNLRTKEDNIIKLDDGMLWHIKLGHASLGYLKQIQKVEEKLKGIKFGKSILDCEVCILAKMERMPFSDNRTRASRPLEIIHTDTMGPIKPASFPGGNRFIVVFLDDHTRFAKAYSVKHKNEAGECLDRFLTTTRNLLGKDEKVCYIRADNGTEFTGGKFLEVMKREKIEFNAAPPHTPELNGTAERFNKTIQNKIRSLMFDSGLPESMWILALEVAVHIYNRTPHKSLDHETPIHMLNPKMKCHLDRIRRFGCIAYAKIPINERKFSERAIRAIMVGYSATGYVLWHPPTGKFHQSRHVRCNEKLVYKNTQYDKSEICNNLEEKENLEENEKEEAQQNLEEKECVDEYNQKENLEEKSLEMEKQTEVRPKKRKSDNKNLENQEVKKRNLPGRNAKTLENREKYMSTRRIQKERLIEDTSLKVISDDPETKYNKNNINDELGHVLLATINKDPTSYREAMESNDKIRWVEAINEELNSMQENNVWKIIDRPTKNKEGKKIYTIDSKWVFKKKTGEHGETVYIGRLVIRGFKDRNEYELKETYAPFSRLAIIRVALAIINKYDLEVHQMDVKTAFLNGILEDEIYMEIPDGLECDPEDRKTKVCKLQKSLYGLRISPKRWNVRFSEEALKLGLEKDINEPCLFTWRKEGKVVMLILYVDDILLAGNDKGKLDEVKMKLSLAFKMKDLGEPENFLGMKIFRDKENKILMLKQTEYIEKILERFNMKDCKSRGTPMVTRQVKNRELRDEENLDRLEDRLHKTKAPYREAIGSLLYLAGATRPDIAFAVNYLSRRQLDATEDDWKNVKRIFRYLRGTSDLGLTYKAKDESLEAITDASFRDWSDSSSTGGYIIKLFGDPIMWRSHKQTYVTLSTCQAEYLAMSEACQELVSLDKAIRDITGKTMYPVTIWCDNKSAIDCTQKDGNHKLKNFDDPLEEIKNNLEDREKTGSKSHMATTHGDYIKSCVSEGKVIPRWVSTKQKEADVMTKPLPSDAHKYLRNKILNLE